MLEKGLTTELIAQIHISDLISTVTMQVTIFSSGRHLQDVIFLEIIYSARYGRNAFDSRTQKEEAYSSRKKTHFACGENT